MFRAYGKALISGSYAITEENVPGLCIGLNSSFYAYTQNLPETKNYENTITIITPQFPDDYNYQYIYTQIYSELNVPKFIKIENILGDSKFIDAAVNVVLSYLTGSKKLLLGKSLSIELFEDEQFISYKNYRSDFKIESKASRGNHYQAFDCRVTECAKTGLGSSACQIVSIIGLMVKELSNSIKEISQSVIEILGQIANAIAAKKCGSGFDIGCAVFGSNLFTRISKNDINDCIVQLDNCENLEIFAEMVELMASKRTIEPFRICDQTNNKNGLIKSQENKLNVYFVDFGFKGLSTAEFVSCVFKFWSQNLEEKGKFVEESKQLTLASKECYQSLFDKDSSQLDHQQIQILKDVIVKQRRNLRKLGENTKTEIEPNVIGLLLDCIVKEHEVIVGMIPGAGGWDAQIILTSGGVDKKRVVEIVKGAVDKVRDFLEKGANCLGKFEIIQTHII